MQDNNNFNGASATSNTIPNNGGQPNNNQNFNGYGSYVEPPKKRNGFLTYIIIFLILAAAGVGGYYGGLAIYNATHKTADVNNQQ